MISSILLVHYVAANKLKELGARHVYAAISHAILSGPACERIQNSGIDKLVITDTIPLPESKRLDKIEVLSLAPMYADIINCIEYGGSLGKVFQDFFDEHYAPRGKKKMRKIVFNETEIQGACERIANELTKDLANDEKIPVFLGVMKGALNFFMDLTKRMEMPIYLDYIQISSYEGTKSTGNVKLLHDLRFDCEGRTVIIVEDIVDTGVSMNYLTKYIQEKYNPKRIIVVTLFDKINARTVPIKIDYSGKVLAQNDFLIGYGLDYKELHRNVPYVYIPDEDEYNELTDLANNS